MEGSPASGPAWEGARPTEPCWKSLVTTRPPVASACQALIPGRAGCGRAGCPRADGGSPGWRQGERSPSALTLTGQTGRGCEPQLGRPGAGPRTLGPMCYALGLHFLINGMETAPGPAPWRWGGKPGLGAESTGQGQPVTAQGTGLLWRRFWGKKLPTGRARVPLLPLWGVPGLPEGLGSWQGGHLHPKLTSSTC